MSIYAVCLLFFLIFGTLHKSYAAAQLKKETFSITAGSFLQHIPNCEDCTQHFNNKFVAVLYRISPKTSLTLGTLKNSFGDRCLAIGVKKDWYDITSRLTFTGGYAYIGEFFLGTFSHCGAEGVYKSGRKLTGIGFAPYIYHGLEYDINKFISIETGYVLPRLVVFTATYRIY